jgi:hypothetical protein
VNQGTNGTISPVGPVSVNATDNSPEFTITPDANYHIADVLVNGLSVGAVPSYTFYSVGADSTISATFAINPYSVTYDGNGNDLGTNPPVDNNLYLAGQNAIVLGNTGGLTNGILNFSGWTIAADGSGTIYTAGQDLPITGNMTLYAKWVP